MFPFQFYQQPQTQAQLQQQSLAREIQSLKESLASMTPEEREDFWADIEGIGPKDAEASDT